jgi:hypothetical protein
VAVSILIANVLEIIETLHSFPFHFWCSERRVLLANSNIKCCSFNRKISKLKIGWVLASVSRFAWDDSLLAAVSGRDEKRVSYLPNNTSFEIACGFIPHFCHLLLIEELQSDPVCFTIEGTLNSYQNAQSLPNVWPIDFNHAVRVNSLCNTKR